MNILSAIADIASLITAVATITLEIHRARTAAAAEKPEDDA